jgi:ribonuclease P protein component
MLSHKNRATRPNIEETIKTGPTIFGNFLYAKISRKDHEKAGFAIVISKKNEKTSVGRHLIKRRISSCIEKSLSKTNTEFKKTAVFFLKKDKKLPIPYSEIILDVDFILKKANFFA